MTLENSLSNIVPVDPQIHTKTQDLLDNKTKPRGSLGRLEQIACRFAAATGETKPALPQKAVIVMAADHGVAKEGVSAYPSEVTAQMVANFTSGGAGINVLSRHESIQLTVVDIGVEKPIPGLEGVVDARVKAGTDNMCSGPAMTRDQAVQAINVGIKIANELINSSIGLIGLGEMGIGNTTAASAITAILTNTAVADVVGRGTGIDDDGLARKIDAIEKAIATNQPDGTDGLDVLSKVGGLEIAGLVGVCIGAAAKRVPIVVDGFITGAAALIAARLSPAIRDYLFAGHVSVEQGHQKILDALGLEPILNLDLRLGEGTGGALAMNVIEASLKILHEMATFESAGVSDTGK